MSLETSFELHFQFLSSKQKKSNRILISSFTPSSLYTCPGTTNHPLHHKKAGTIRITLCGETRCNNKHVTCPGENVVCATFWQPSVPSITPHQFARIKMAMDKGEVMSTSQYRTWRLLPEKKIWEHKKIKKINKKICIIRYPIAGNIRTKHSDLCAQHWVPKHSPIFCYTEKRVVFFFLKENC